MNEFTVAGKLLSAIKKESKDGKPYGTINIETTRNNKKYTIQLVVFGKLSERLPDLVENSQVFAKGHITSDSKTVNDQVYFKTSLVCDVLQYMEQ